MKLQDDLVEAVEHINVEDNSMGKMSIIDFLKNCLLFDTYFSENVCIITEI